MRFIYYKSKSRDLNFIKNNILFESEVVYNLSDSEIVKVDPKFNDYRNNSLFFNGRILFEGFNEVESQEIFRSNIFNLEWPISNDASGYFSGFLVNDGKTYIFNDPVGINNLFYYHNENEIIISTTLSAIHTLKGLELDYASLVLETVPPFIQYGNATVLKGVKRLLPGELIVMEDFEIIQMLYDVTIKNNDSIPEENFTKDLVDLINTESAKLFKNHVILSLSGGIDSRVNLAPLLFNGNEVSAINYGLKGCVDTDIPVRMSCEFDFDICVKDPTPYLFPQIETLYRWIEDTDSIYVNSWHSILLDKNLEGSTFLLGDMLDILRAKSIKSLKTRKFRTSFYIKKFFFRKKLELNSISDRLIAEFISERKSDIIEKVRKNFKYFNFSEEIKTDILNRICEDIEISFSHLRKYNFKSIESYEEFFELFTSGRLSMGKQLNILNSNYRAEIPLANLKILRKVLNTSPNYRYADELTTQMFRVKSWNSLGKFPTAQNPINSYNGNFFIMLFGWFLRSKTDYLLTKIFTLTKGKSKRNRLFQTYDHQKSYSYPGAIENFKSYFPKNDFCDFSEKIELFEKRRIGESWPLSSMDLMPFAQAMYYVTKFGRK